MNLRRGGARLPFFAVLVSLAALAACGGGTADSSDKVPATNTVTLGGPGRAIPRGFLGMSLELPAVVTEAGKDPNAVNPVLEQLIRNLTPGQRPVLRLGGDSSDWSWVQIGRTPKPPWARYTISSTWFGVTKALAQAVGAKLILGLNLEANSARIADAEANAIVSKLGRSSILALEIGNEPELYGSFSWYHNAAGQHFRGRPRSYSFQDFIGDFSRVAATVKQTPIAGPALGSVHWMPLLPQFLHAEPRLSLVTLHAYPLKNCSRQNNVTVPQLLAESATRGLANNLSRYAREAHARHIPMRVGEINSISCGGQRGISETFATSLWALDAMFALASAGVDGVNFHVVPHSLNELFDFSFSHGRWHGTVSPNYYGLLMFAQATPAGSQMLKVSGTTQGIVRTWATRAPDGHIRVVVINTGAAGHTTFVRATGATGAGTLERLTAPSLSSKGKDVRLGGTSFGPQTTTGVLTGTPSTQTVPPKGHTYTIVVPGHSAALLTLSP